MTHYILETTVYEPVESQLLPVYRRAHYKHLRRRIGAAGHPGVWLTRGKIKLEHGDTFEERRVVINSHPEAVVIATRYEGQSIVVEYPSIDAGVAT